MACGLCFMSPVSTSQPQEQREGSPGNAVGMGLEGRPSGVSGSGGCV